MCRPRSFGEIVCTWSITGPYVPLELQPASGDSASIEEAKAAFRAKGGRQLGIGRDRCRSIHMAIWGRLTL